MESRPDLHVILNHKGCVSSTAVNPLHAMTMDAEYQYKLHYIKWTTRCLQEQHSC